MLQEGVGRSVVDLRTVRTASSSARGRRSVFEHTSRGMCTRPKMKEWRKKKKKIIHLRKEREQTATATPRPWITKMREMAVPEKEPNLLRSPFHGRGSPRERSWTRKSMAEETHNPGTRSQGYFILLTLIKRKPPSLLFNIMKCNAI